MNAAWGEKRGNRYNYINSLTYDEFGQRKYIVYGNGVKSSYSYDDKTRRLESLITTTPDTRTVQNMSYGYDLVGNVHEIKNTINVPTNTALPAGPVIQQFTYDDLYQLTIANGEYQFGPGKGNRYQNEFSYDTIGNFTRKYQQHKIIQPSAAEHLPKETNYLLNYKYTGSHPHAVTDAGDKLYSYDAGGNMTGWDDKTSGKRRTILWNEENRVKEIQDNGKSSYFLYDDQGERVLKRGQHGETFYINRFYSIRNGELGTKSIYAGNTRVVSKLVKTPNTTTANTQTTTNSTTPGINGLDNGQGKKLGIIRRLNGTTTTAILPPEEKDQFFYHGDHLGSSNMITDSKGAIYQHLEYFPYGETWIEEGGSYGGNTPGYKFTGKELDPETGLYYFGARYYEPVISRWISADPILGDYLPTGNKEAGRNLPGLGGIYNALNLGVYSYAHHNPIRLIDPTGNSTTIDDNGVVQDVRNDKDLSIYQTLPKGVAGPPQKVGETYFADTFKKGNKVHVGVDKTAEYKKLANEAANRNSILVGLDSRLGRRYDVKNQWKEKASDGVLLFGLYATVEDVGNALAGTNARTSGVTYDAFQRMAGAVHQKHSSPLELGAAFMGYRFGPAPTYGEVTEQYRMSLIGYFNSFEMITTNSPFK